MIYVLCVCIYIVISLAFNRKLDIITTALPMITKAETLRKLGVKKFPVPEAGEDIALKGSNKVGEEL